MNTDAPLAQPSRSTTALNSSSDSWRSSRTIFRSRSFGRSSFACTGTGLPGRRDDAAGDAIRSRFLPQHPGRCLSPPFLVLRVRLPAGFDFFAYVQYEPEAMKTPFLLALLVPMAAVAQRLIPSDVQIAGSVYALAEFDDKLIIGGDFDAVNGQPISNIVAWDGGTGFDDLGAPMPSGQVTAVLPYANGVVFGGLAPGDYRRVFHWNGDTTTVLGTPGSGRINCFTEFNGDLIVGGSFFTMDGVVVNRIARWDGMGWTSMGTGLNQMVRSVLVHQGQLYVAGDFTATADGTTQLAYLARWDGSAFQPVGTGLSGKVQDLLSMPNGLWMAGSFRYTADSTVALNQFAVFNGDSFAPLIPDFTGFIPVGDTFDHLMIPVGGIGVLAMANDRLVYKDGEWKLTWLPKLYCALEYQGKEYAGGNSSIYSMLCRKLALRELLPGNGPLPIDVAGVRSWVGADGVLFLDQEEQMPSFTPWSEGGASVIYAHGQYVVGYVGDSAFTSSFSPYGNHDCDGKGYDPGPRCTERDLAFRERYSRTWPIDIGQLWEHAAHWNDPGYTVPEVLANWPAHGDPGNGEPAQLVPFQDMDGDGLYEPDQGDMPVIRGDKAVLTVVSDQIADTMPGMRPSMFDSRILVHGFDNGPEALHHTLLVNYAFTNRSDRTYDSVVVAMTTDPDLGCAGDDFIGCDPELDMFYVYNADATDEECNGQPGFGLHPPAIGIVGLSAPMRAFIYFNHEGAACCNDPQSAQHAANYAEGIWKDGSPLINPITNDTTRFMFSDYPDVPGSYHETALIDPDRRGTASFGPFFNVAPGETICFDMAFVFARDTTQDNIQNTRVLQQKVIALKQWYAQQAYGCGEYPDVGIQAPVEDGAALTLYPNPAQGQVTAARTDIREAWHVSVRSVTGELVHQALWPAGTRTWGFTTDALAEGVYMVRFSGDPGQVVRRLVVAR